MGILRHPPVVVLFAAVRRPTLTRIADPSNIKSMPAPSGWGVEWRGSWFTTRLKNRDCTQAPRKLFPVVLPGRTFACANGRTIGANSFHLALASAPSVLPAALPA